jgi:transposase-like protein
MAAKSPTSPILAAIREASREESKAVDFFEAQRWEGHPWCPICGSTDVYAMKDRRTGERNKDYRWRCRDCGKMYSVRTGTVLEETRLPLRVWVHAFWRACASKKGVSALQISRECEISYKSALFLMHRIREAMKDDGEPLTGVVEVDETYIGGKRRRPHGMHRKVEKRPDGKKHHKRWGSYGQDKEKVLAMVERGGRARMVHMERVTSRTVASTLTRQLNTNARLMTDESSVYNDSGWRFAGHDRVNHNEGEYVRGDATTNAVEGFFSLLKRGIYGTFHSVSAHHLHRYLNEFSFRHNTRSLDDGERVVAAVRGADGKRLLYRQPA